MSASNSEFLDEATVEEWERRLSESGRIKVVRSRPREEFSRESNPKRRNTRMTFQEKKQVTKTAQTPPRPQQPKPLPFLGRMSQLGDLQGKRDELQAQLKEIEAQHAQLLSVRRQAEEEIRKELDTITPRELGSIQTQLILAEEEGAKEIREAMRKLNEVAQNANFSKVATLAASYLKTAESFRLVWQGLSEEEREERALVARVSPDNAKAFYRAAIAYDKRKLAKQFLEELPPEWKEAIEGKRPVPGKTEE